MRALCLGLALMALSFGLLAQVEAGGEKKKKGGEVTLKGKITCAKCDLGTETECTTVIVTKIDKKDVTVYFDAASHKKHHGAVCTEAKEGSVKGVVKTEGDKKVIAVKELKFN